jgi:hypothetical protein
MYLDTGGATPSGVAERMHAGATPSHLVEERVLVVTGMQLDHFQALAQSLACLQGNDVKLVLGQLHERNGSPAAAGTTSRLDRKP